ncbi:hypothetical protein KAJ41_00625 [Candidatus Parcubacteria bacterium]|nr:hypothetical protein [Candidatus Parcubacteria bacterium]
MKMLISRKILLFMIFFSVFFVGQFSFTDINVIGVKVATAGCVPGPNDANSDGDDCDPKENLFNCKRDCLPAGIPTKTPEDALDAIIKWILGFGLVLSVIFLIWGGIYYIGSSGDSQKTETAKKIIKYAILGIIVIGASFAIISVISTMLAP